MRKIIGPGLEELQGMFAGQRATAVVAVVGVMLAAACSGGGSEPEPSQPATTEPALTAPPTPSPEEQAEAEIQATFEDLVAAWDDFKANASDYGGAPGWNVDLVGQWGLEGDANAELANWLAAWRSSEVEQVGHTVVAEHSVSDIDRATSDDGGLASSTACLDMADLEYRTFDGGIAELPAEPADFQAWSMTWVFGRAGSGESADPGWRLFEVDVAIDESC